MHSYHLVYDVAYHWPDLMHSICCIYFVLDFQCMNSSERFCGRYYIELYLVELQRYCVLLYHYVAPQCTVIY